MKFRKRTTGFLLFFCLLISCKQEQPSTIEASIEKTFSIEEEEKAILATLNNETKAAFERDYEGWQSKWVHDSDITKTYIDFPENTFSESMGWEEISGFVKTFFEEHPEPEPVPKMLTEIDVRLYGKGAWVTYMQQDSLRGLKRETRLMEKVAEEWKIAGMQTTIYGFE